MRKAVETGAEMIEFDVQMTRDRIPILLHDNTIDRTSDGTGLPSQYTLEELRRFNFGKFNGCMQDEYIPIPTLEEIFSEFRELCAMNIQVYADTPADLEIILALYRKYDMYDHGFMAMSTFVAAAAVKAIDPKADLGIFDSWKERGNPDMMRRYKDNGARFCQPVREFLYPDTFTAAHTIGIFANVFKADTTEEIIPLIKGGADGILTNRIDVLVQCLDAQCPAK